MLPELVLIGILQVTAYQPVPEQTDDTPYLTSTGDLVTRYGAAISQDLLKSGQACYGDTVLIEGYGLRVINDAMGAYTYRTNPPKKQEMAVDMLVLGRLHESLVDVQQRKVWVLRSPVRACNRQEAIVMGLVNAKRVRRALDAFKKQNGREPNQQEFHDLLDGKLAKKFTPHEALETIQDYVVKQSNSTSK